MKTIIIHIEASKIAFLFFFNKTIKKIYSTYAPYNSTLDNKRL